MSQDARIVTFEEFWPFYLSQHASATCRALHYLGTTSALAVLLTAAVLQAPMVLLLVPVFGYGPPWIGHYFVEKNRPATFTYPLWSLRADFRMYARAIQGRMGEELARARG